MEQTFEMVAKTFQGLEDVLRDELISLGAKNVELGTRMVSFEGDLEIMYKANLCCRTALRILKPIEKFTAYDPDELYNCVREIDWEKYMTVDSTFSIDSTVNSADFTHSKFVTYRVKDGIADHFNDKYGRRPSIRLNGADVQLNVHIFDDRITISLDSSGEPLSKRGYRVEQTEAPINEVLAAGIIMKTGWRGDCDFADPMCGSGTFLIEAALIAANIWPGIYRESFAFEKWPDFDADLFEEIYNDDSQERDFNFKIYGGDIDPEAVMIARKNVKNAKVDDMVDIRCCPMADWVDNAEEGVLVMNPPYGERIRPESMTELYESIGTSLKTNFKGWHAWIIGYRDEHFADIGLKPSVKITLFNGGLECSLREYVLFDGRYNDFRANGGSIGNLDREEEKRPRKMKHISDDDWKRESRKFSGKKEHRDPRQSDRREKKDVLRPGKRFANDWDDDFDDMESFEPRAPRSFDRQPAPRGERAERGERRPSKPHYSDRRDDRKDFRRDDRKNDRKDFRRDDRRDDRKDFRKDFRRDDRRDDRKDFRRDDRRDDRKDFPRDDRRKGGFTREYGEPKPRKGWKK